MNDNLLEQPQAELGLDSPTAQNPVEPPASSPDKPKRGRKPGAKSGDDAGAKSAFSQFAWNKSLSVGNAPMKACRFASALEAVRSGQDASGLFASLIESEESGVTGRKDAKSSKTDEESVTFAKARYAVIPDGADAICITFDLKVHNATSLPQSANLDTWEKLKQADAVVLAGVPMSIHQALTARAPEIFGRVAQQVFSGEWAWRNRREATQWQVIVQNEAGQAVTDAAQLASDMTNAFEQKTAAVWRVFGLFKIGTGISRVAYPSQLLKLDGSDAEKKIAQFYRIPAADGQGDFALRAVKIGNRLKTIDTWYARYAQLQMPIPVEPMGYAHHLRAALRKKGETAIDLMTRLVTAKTPDEKTLTENEALYLAGITLFGGLLTAEDNKDKSKDDKGNKAAAEEEDAGGVSDEAEAA